VLIAIEAKNSLQERTVKRMIKAGWTPGSNAFHYFMSKGSLVGENDGDAKQKQKQELMKACPHMRVLAWQELESAMGPTIYWVFKHLRVVGAVYQKEQHTRVVRCL
jgi:hypothetical protein